MTEFGDQIVRFGQLKIHVKTLFLVLGCIAMTLLFLTYDTTQQNSADMNIRTGYMDPQSWVSRIYNTTVPTIRRETEVTTGVRKLRLLCIILTMEKDISTKVDAVNKTWAKRCDKHLYVIHSTQKRFDFLNIDVPDDRHKLIDKMQNAYKIIYERYIEDFDFLLKADDDTYVVVENLKYLLWHYNANEPGYLGYHFNKFVSHGYMSGGAGYVISNRGLRHLVERGYNRGLCTIKKRKDDPENSEDIETSRCLEASGVEVWSSLDIKGRETFHPYPLEQHLFGNLPSYVYSWAKNPVQSGKNCCGKYVISFHYMKPDAILFVDHLLYDVNVFGLHHEESLTSEVFQIGPVFNENDIK